MKKCFLLIGGILVLSATACVQKLSSSSIPSVVVNALSTRYTSLNGLEWEKQGNLYEAEFRDDGREMEVQIENSGRILMEKLEIPATDLPEAVTSILQSRFTGYRVEEASRVETGGSVYFQVELEARGKSDVKKIFNATGTEETKRAYWD